MMGGVYPHPLRPDRPSRSLGTRFRNEAAQAIQVHAVLEDHAAPDLTHGDALAIAGFENRVSRDVDEPHHDPPVTLERSQDGTSLVAEAAARCRVEHQF